VHLSKARLTLSHSFCSSFMAAGDSRSGRMESACPSLIYAGPRLVMMLRSWMARFTCSQYGDANSVTGLISCEPCGSYMCSQPNVRQPDLILLCAILHKVEGQAAKEAAGNAQKLHHTRGDGHWAPPPVVCDDVRVVIQGQNLQQHRWIM
jgi:hypothetical protein